MINYFLKEKLNGDSKDVLNPKACQGEYLIPNILKYLGANENVAENPATINTIYGSIFLMLDSQKELRRVLGGIEPPTRDNIARIIQCIEQSKENASNTGGDNSYLEIVRIDRDTGNIIDELITFKFSFGENEIDKKRKIYSTDGNGNTIITIEEVIECDDVKRKISRDKTVFNNRGVALKRKKCCYDQDGKIISEITVIRDSGNPLIIYQKEKSKIQGKKYTKIGYEILEHNPDQLPSSLDFKRFTSDKQDVENFFELYKNSIVQKLEDWLEQDNRLSDEISFKSNPYNYSIKKGLKILAENAVLLRRKKRRFCIF